MPKRPKPVNGVKKMDSQAPTKKSKPKVTWANASDQIQIALACLERDTETGLKTLKSKIEAVGREARAVGEAAKASSKREH
jgi:hypothetical protein